MVLPPTKNLRLVGAFLRRRLVHLKLQIPYNCNFRCAICGFWKGPYKSMRRLSLADVETITAKLGKTGPLIVSIGGGEPLMHPELTGIIRTLAALEILHKNRTNAHQRVHMISVVMDHNLDEIEPLIRLAKEISVTYLVTFYSHARGTKASRALDRDVAEHLLALCRKHANFVAIRGYLSRFSEASENDAGIRPCYAGKNLFNIDCQGNATRCIDRLEQVAGNLLTDDFVDIERELLRQHQANDCGACWTSCRGNFETLMYGPKRWLNLLNSRRVVAPVALVTDS